MEALLKKHPRSVTLDARRCSVEGPPRKARPPSAPPLPEDELNNRLRDAEAGLYDKFVSAIFCVNWVDVVA